jgi:hypothetical protein
LPKVLKKNVGQLKKKTYYLLKKIGTRKKLGSYIFMNNEFLCVFSDKDRATKFLKETTIENIEIVSMGSGGIMRIFGEKKLVVINPVDGNVPNTEIISKLAS